MSETVDNEIRDEVMANILAKPPNQVCFDCGSKAPKWSSPYLGIVICYECAAKHRSYGTHISFVRSVDLDKWNRKQLKSLELTGNSFTKERFNDLGVPLIGGNYDYNNSMVLKVRQEIAEKVRESLKPDDYKKVENKKKEVDEFENININNEEIKEEEKEKEKKKEKNDKKKKKDKNEEKVEEKNEEIEEKEEIKKPQKFEVDKKAKVENAKVIGKAGKINRIKKMDFNFDFDSFNDVNFSDFTKKDEDNDKEKKEDDEKKDEDEQKEKEHEKEKEKESENEGYQKSYGKKISKKELKNKFANKKAISSEDYAALEEGNSDNKIVKDRIKSMGNSQAISSEDVFGSNGESNVYEGESMTDKLKDMALNFTLSAAEKAKALKNKTNEFINKVQNKFSGGGY
jgi:hypothetical protein